MSFEDAVDLIHPALQFLALFFAEFVSAREDSRLLAAGICGEMDSEVLPRIGRCELARDDADRAGDGGGVGEDGVAAAGDVVAAASGDVAHRNDERLLFFHALGGVENDFARDG